MNLINRMGTEVTPTLRECWAIAQASCAKLPCRKILIGVTRRSWRIMCDLHYPPLPPQVEGADTVDIQMDDDCGKWEDDDSRVCHVRVIPGEGESVRVVAVE